MPLRRRSNLLVMGQGVGTGSAVWVLTLTGTNRTLDAPSQVPVGPWGAVADHDVSTSASFSDGLCFGNLCPSNDLAQGATGGRKDPRDLRGGAGRRHEVASRSQRKRSTSLSV